MWSEQARPRHPGCRRLISVVWAGKTETSRLPKVCKCSLSRQDRDIHHSAITLHQPYLPVTQKSKPNRNWLHPGSQFFYSENAFKTSVITIYFEYFIVTVTELRVWKKTKRDYWEWEFKVTSFHVVLYILYWISSLVNDEVKCNGTFENRSLFIFWFLSSLWLLLRGEGFKLWCEVGTKGIVVYMYPCEMSFLCFPNQRKRMVS